ncbi:pyridoxamine 5'-phosphate oxidase family protein [Synechococcus sp. GEYO]|uniref:pyridoxamine 5'-phosphate oxidase family protein n=1 Tax=Synechococcus sp. GEYO TaxID=2575511 RepID=UPI001FCAA71C|nr:pyridoxamine 5'-phosphate oxidase family protein [Synechococcus sp. GEYO]
MSLPPWRSLMRSARQREGRSPGATWLQLATTAEDGTPRVRTLVFRGWSPRGDLELLTDVRSEKSSQLPSQPRVELCWLFRKAKEQFRLRGRAHLVTAEQEPEALLDHWQRLSPSGRMVWAWPSPGEPFDAQGPWPQEVADDEPISSHLLIMRVALERVEQLDLKPHPHLRRSWELRDGWHEQRLNP